MDYVNMCKPLKYIKVDAFAHTVRWHFDIIFEVCEGCLFIVKLRKKQEIFSCYFHSNVFTPVLNFTEWHIRNNLITNETKHKNSSFLIIYTDSVIFMDFYWDH